jgi:acetyl esterase/lipase
MARRPRRGFAVHLTLLVVLTACTAGDGNPGVTSASTFTTTQTTTTTTTVPPITSTTTVLTTTTRGGEPADVDVDVGIPEGAGPFPAVVLVHGGGWVAGNPSAMRALARELNDAGFLTVNTRYQLASLEIPGFPEAIEDVVCAVRYAASLPESDGTVALIGHSAGAHIGAVVALSGDEYVGDCPIDGSGVPERFVGLAGPYDVSRVGLAMLAFFGEGPTVAPEAWEAGNPQLLTGRNPALRSLIMYGELDGFVDDRFAFDFYEALVESGSEVVLELVEGARHNDLLDPDLVGDLIVTWLER